VKAPSVSIIIPTYNRQELLLKSVESCLAQDGADLEIIIVDDGSSDQTQAIVKAYLEGEWKDCNIHYMFQDNAGASAARNHGLNLAKGKYIQFLDSDDLLMPTKITKQITVLEEPQNSTAACCYCYGKLGRFDTYSCSAAANKIGYHAKDPAELIQKLCSRMVHGMQTSAPLWRSDFLNQHTGWREDISLGDDLEYHIRLLVDAESICFVDEELFYVREHTASRLSADKISLSSLNSQILTRRAIFNTLQHSGLWDAPIQQVFLNAMRTIYANALQLGDPKTISDLEDWLCTLACLPDRKIDFLWLISIRRLLGRRFLLGTHKLITKLRVR
jgi:glycosyltransferase involved in cell wall biosynthesis